MTKTTFHMPEPHDIGECVTEGCLLGQIQIAFGEQLNPMRAYTAKADSPRGVFCAALAEALGVKTIPWSDGEIYLGQIAKAQDKMTPEERAGAWRTAAIVCGLVDGV